MARRTRRPRSAWTGSGFRVLLQRRCRVRAPLTVEVGDVVKIDGGGVFNGLADPIPIGIDENGDQPGFAVAAGLELMQGTACFETGFLHQIFSVRLLARQAPGKAQQGG